MSDKDLNQIAKIERAIAEKYGEQAIENPRSNWNEEKEKEYLSQMKDFYEKIGRSEQSQKKIDINGIKVSKKLLNRESLGRCPVCETFSKKSMDDVCLTKFNCCSNCYYKYVEDREERWLKGRRPNENKQETT